MCAMIVRKAARKNVKARVIISGPTGSGKTMSALLFAYGLTGDWDKIVVLDSESGSGELYTGASVPGDTVVIGNYAYIGIDPPFTTDKYLGALRAAEEYGAEVIIIDSLTHLWQGEGGILSKHDRITDADKYKNSFTAWRKITPELNAFIESMLRSKAHVILTLRSKMEYSQVKDENTGKNRIEKLGLAPIFKEGITYESTILFELNDQHFAVCGKDRTGLFADSYAKITPDTGKKYLEWAESGATPIERPPIEKEEPPAPSTPPPAKQQPRQDASAAAEPEQHTSKVLSPAQVKYIGSQIKRLFIDSGLGGTTEILNALICEKYGNVDTIEQIPMAEANRILTFLKEESVRWKDTVTAAQKKIDTPNLDDF